MQKFIGLLEDRLKEHLPQKEWEMRLKMTFSRFQRLQIFPLDSDSGFSKLFEEQTMVTPTLSQP